MKRFIVIMLSVLSALIMGALGSSAEETSNVYYVADAEWVDEIKYVRPVIGNLIMVSLENGQCGLIDIDGKIISEPQWDDIGEGCEELGLITVSQEGLVGMIDTAGRVVIEPQWTSINMSEEYIDACSELLVVTKGSKYGFIDLAGNVVVEPIWDGAGAFCEERALVRRGDYFGFIDMSGNVVGETRWSGVDWFSNSVAVVYVKNPDGSRYKLKGLINHDGRVVISPEWETIDVFDGGVVRVEKDNRYALYDITGNVICDLGKWDDIGDFSEGLAVVEKDDRYGYIDLQGRVVIRPKYDDADDFSDGLAWVNEAGRYGLIGSNGKNVSKAQWEHHGNFEDGLAYVRAKWEDPFGYIDRSGKIVIPLQWDQAYDFSEGRALVRKGDKYGYIDTNGTVISEPQWDENSTDFCDGFAIVRKAGYMGIIDADGNIVTEPTWNYITDFTDPSMKKMPVGLFEVHSEDGTGYIDHSGNIVCEPQWSYTEEFIGDLAFVANGSGQGIINKQGEIVIGFGVLPGTWSGETDNAAQSQLADEAAPQVTTEPLPDLPAPEDCDYAYTVQADRTIVITKYIGEESTIMIPKAIGSLPVTALGDGKTSIFDDANPFVTSVTIPDSVTTIGDYAFYACKRLESIVISDSVVNIGKESFRGCHGLTDITIPGSVANIGEYAFYYCNNLAKVTLLEGAISIGDHAFGRCENLSSIVINGNVTSIGESAFSGCGNLTEFTMPAGITHISKSAFGGCRSLTTFTIPDGVVSIGESAFSYCERLMSITIPGSVTNIGKSAFSNCYSLADIEIPDSVTSIGTSAFENCDSLTSITIPGSVKNIARSFSLCNKLTSIILLDGVTTIGNDAFKDCSYLTDITIPKSVTSIGNSAFDYCQRLTSIDLPNSVTSIGDEAFNYCSGLTSILIPDSVTSIGKSAFASCNSLMTITIPGSITTIDEHLFTRCARLSSVIILDGVTNIENGAFSNCSNLTSVTLPNSVKQIGGSAFEGCSGLLSITLPNSVEEIGGYGFAYCKNLASITIPESVKKIGDYAFFGCKGLTNVIVCPNTYAERYCKENELSYKYFDASADVTPTTPSIGPVMDNTPASPLNPPPTPVASTNAPAVIIADNSTGADSTVFDQKHLLPYITEIGIVNGDKDCKERLDTDVILDVDLNKGAGGDYIYLGYRTSDDPSQAITGVLLNTSENPPSAIVYNNASFSLIGGSEENNVSADGVVDLNAGARGKYLYLYITRDPSYGPPIEAVKITDSSQEENGYICATNMDSVPQDLNEGAGGDYLYLHYLPAYTAVPASGVTTAPTAVPTATPAPTAVPTAAPTATPAPTAVPTATPTATPAPTAVPTATPTATAAPVVTETPIPAKLPIAQEEGAYQHRTQHAAANSHVVANSGDYSAAMAVDGNEATSWQFSTKKVKLGEAALVIALQPGSTVDELWIKNGFWFINNGLDQYTRNGRPKEIAVGLLYDGESEYRDEVKLTLRDDKERKDWQKLNLGRHENVSAVRIRVISIYKGTKFTTDVAISEVMLVEREGDMPTIVYETLQRGNKSEEVLAMKERLRELGYFKKNADLSNSYNDTCVERVKQFQKVNGLPQTGIADHQTLMLLYSDAALPKSN